MGCSALTRPNKCLSSQSPTEWPVLAVSVNLLCLYLLISFYCILLLINSLYTSLHVLQVPVQGAFAQLKAVTWQSDICMGHITDGLAIQSETLP